MAYAIRFSLILMLFGSTKLNFDRFANTLGFARFKRGQRQDDVELTAGEVDLVIAGAFNPDAPAMRFDDAFGKCQPQTGAATFETRFAGGMLAEFAGLIELGENDLAQVRVYTYTGITDDDLNTTIGKVDDRRNVFACNGDPAVVGREFDRVANKVME